MDDELTCGHLIKSGPHRGDLCQRPWHQSFTSCIYHIAPATKIFLKRKREQEQAEAASHKRGHIGIPAGIPFLQPDDPFWPNQIKAGQEVLRVYQQIHYGVLVAQCQSGKTGAAKNIMRHFRNTHLDAIVILLIPISSNDILGQAQREFREEVYPENILSLPQMLNTDCLKDRLAAYPGRAFLIVVDESHMNALVIQSANCLFNTLRNAGIAANGTMVPDQCWLLSISATPNAELAGLVQAAAQGRKAVVYLKPGADYYGLKDMQTLGRVKEALKLGTTEEQMAMIRLLQETYGRLNKYAILRMKSHAHCEEFSRRLASVGIPALIFDTYVKRSSQVAVQVQVKPEGFTVILIIHRLRASIQIDSRNICMVHENNIRHVDTTTQGLPGRMCGYGKRGHAVDVYCNPEAVAQQVAWLDDQFGSKSIPYCRSISGRYTEPDVSDEAPPSYCQPIRKSIYHCEVSNVADEEDDEGVEGVEGVEV